MACSGLPIQIIYQTEHFRREQWPESTRSSQQRCSMKKRILKNFTKFTGKHLCRVFFLIKPATLLKKRPWQRCFPVNFVKFLRALFPQNTSKQLLLEYDNKFRGRLSSAFKEQPPEVFYKKGIFFSALKRGSNTGVFL